MRARFCETLDDIRLAVPVLLQLRTSFTEQQLLTRIHQQQDQGYKLAIVEQDEQVLCVAGLVVQQKLAWGKHIYIDDLVSDQQTRSRGAGKCMLDFLKHWGRQQGCQQLHLDSGVQRFAAHRFYLREGFDIASHHFSCKL